MAARTWMAIWMLPVALAQLNPMQTNHECAEHGSGFLAPKDAFPLDRVIKWAESACDSHTFSWSPVNYDKGGAFCCETRDISHAIPNPTWNIYQLVDKGAANFKKVIRLAAKTQWTSEDEREKMAADFQSSNATLSKLQSIQKSLALADHRLQDQSSILEIIQTTLDTLVLNSASDRAKLEDQEKVVEEDKKDLVEKHAALQSAIAAAREASHEYDLKLHALHVCQREVDTRVEDKESAEAALKKADDHLNDLIADGKNIGRSDTIAASNDVKDKQAKLDSAKAALFQLQRECEGLEQEASLAGQQVGAGGVWLRKELADNASSAAYAKLNSDNETLVKMREAIGPVVAHLQQLKQRLESQKSVVESMKSTNASLHQKLHAKKHKYDELQKTLKQDLHCEDELQKQEGFVSGATLSYNYTLAAYQALPDDPDLIEAAWEAADVLEVALYKEYLKQKACAPEDVNIPPRFPPKPCGKDTNGTCRFFWCHRTRESYCDKGTSKCLCPAATCAEDGACRSRGPPNTVLAKPTALGQVTTHATITAPLQTGSLEFLVIITATLITVVAAVVKIRSASRRVELPTHVLG